MSKIIDPLFGEMNKDFDKIMETYFLDKKVRLTDGVDKVVLFITSNNQISSEKQFTLFKNIEKEFSQIWKSAISFLVDEKKYIKVSLLENSYRLESITLHQEPDHWEMELLNTKDGFTSILVEFNGVVPVDFSVEG